MARTHQKKIDTIRWAGFVHSGSLSAGSAAVTILSAFATVKETIMRTRGELLCYVDSTSAPGGLAEIACGFILAQSGQSTTVLSAPITDAQAQWLWYERFFIGYEEMVTDVIDVPVISGMRKVIDSKAMRIINPNQEVQFVIENVTQLTAVTVNFAVGGRFLLGH